MHTKSATDLLVLVNQKLITGNLLWAPTGYEKPKHCGNEKTYSPNPMQVPFPNGG